MGRVFINIDTKITDLLYILHAHLKYSVPYEDIWKMLYDRFTGVQADLKWAGF